MKKIAIIAPASRSPKSDVEKAQAWLKSHGVESDILIEFNEKHPYFSASNKTRFMLLKKALLDKKYDVIWCMRGGYGTLALLDEVKKLKIPKHKILIGFSDITSLHLLLAQKFKLKTIHGPMLLSVGRESFTQAHLEETLSFIKGDLKEFQMKLTPFNKAAKNKKLNIKAELTGGNLAVIQASMKTEFEMKTKNKILFLEDIGERGYKLSRLLTHLKLTGLLDEVKAIILGVFNDGDEPSGENHVEFALNEFAETLKIPVFKTDEIGHDSKNRFLVYNTKYIIDKNNLKLTV